MSKNRKSYSVPEMKKMLGIGKTSAYALVKTGCFETTVAGGKIRILKDSFHKWLNGQTYYSIKEEGES